MSETSDSLLWLDRYLKAEEDISEETLSHFQSEFERYKRSFNLLSDTIDWLYDSTKNKPFDSFGKQAIMLIIPRVMQSIQSIRALLLKGYYYDVSILERGLMEGVGLCAYLALNEEEAKRWFKGKDTKTAKIRLFDYVNQLLGTKVENAKKVYGQLCEYVHTSVRALSTFVAFGPIPRVVVSLTPNFDKDKMKQIAHYPTLFLTVLKEIFADEIPQKRREDIMSFLKNYMKELADVDYEIKTDEKNTEED